MPTKYKESVRTVHRETKAVSVQHYYVTALSNTALVEMVQANNTVPKLKSKLMNEVRRRGITPLIQAI